MFLNNTLTKNLALAAAIALMSTALVCGCRDEENHYHNRVADDEQQDDELEDTGPVEFIPILPDPTLPFVPTNVGTISLAGITGDLIFDGRACSSPGLNGDTGEVSCSSTPGYTFQQVQQTDGSRIGVFAARNVRLESTEFLELRGTIPIVIVALEDVLIAGTIEGSAGVIDAVAGGYSAPGPTDASFDGNGPGGGVSYNDFLGGGGSFCGLGGTEGNGQGTGGEPYGNEYLSPLMGGSSGAGVSSGGGGGAFQITAGGTIRIAANGVVNMPGEGDKAGGGSGGAILLEASAIVVEGVLSANGGGGDGSGSVSPQSGRPNDQPAEGAVAADKPGDGGGNGSAGDSINGEDGHCATTPCEFGGSGGGGAGRIRINTPVGAAQVTGIVSPSLSTPCATQGVLLKTE